MHGYRILDTANDPAKVNFRKTQAEAFACARSFPRTAWPDVCVQQVVVRTDADSVHDYLNGRQPAEPTVLRTWKLTSRGGLIQVDARRPRSNERMTHRSRHLVSNARQSASDAAAFWATLNQPKS